MREVGEPATEFISWLFPTNRERYQPGQYKDCYIATPHAPLFKQQVFTALHIICFDSIKDSCWSSLSVKNDIFILAVNTQWNVVLWCNSHDIAEMPNKCSKIRNRSSWDIVTSLLHLCCLFCSILRCVAIVSYHVSLLFHTAHGRRWSRTTSLASDHHSNHRNGY